MQIRSFYKNHIFVVGIIFYILIYHVVPLIERIIIFPTFHLSLFHGTMGWAVYSGIDIIFLYFLIQQYSQRDSIFEIPKIKALAITGIGYILYSLFIKYMLPLVLITSNQAVLNTAATNESTIAIYIQLFHVTLIGPFLEELLFRGLLIERKGSKLICGLTLLIASLLFGSIHMAYGYATLPFIYYTGIGLILSLVYCATKRLQYPIMIHITINVLASWEALTIYF
ncbi:CPBP family intramembrane glutamic endopeptidase [Leuconostoc lactis]|uniref:CPBP family intramembrane glutamic endopeptidase n=1 Tax=Leuconostoc lactis TaxID=1246 RepID=UPI001896C90A|nr:type II CAAX endopeptidase family protein [Leuconostoc lactis]